MALPKDKITSQASWASADCTCAATVECIVVDITFGVAPTVVFLEALGRLTNVVHMNIKYLPGAHQNKTGCLL